MAAKKKKGKHPKKHKGKHHAKKHHGGHHKGHHGGHHKAAGHHPKRSKKKKATKHRCSLCGHAAKHDARVGCLHHDGKGNFCSCKHRV